MGREMTDAELRVVVGGLTMATKFLAEQWGGLRAGRDRRISRTVARQSIGPNENSPPLFPRPPK